MTLVKDGGEYSCWHFEVFTFIVMLQTFENIQTFGLISSAPAFVYSAFKHKTKEQILLG